jgi:hypothetical protein
MSEPRTDAGRSLLRQYEASLHPAQSYDPSIKRAILAIEDEAAGPSLIDMAIGKTLPKEWSFGAVDVAERVAVLHDIDKLPAGKDHEWYVGWHRAISDGGTGGVRR